MESTTAAKKDVKRYRQLSVRGPYAYAVLLGVTAVEPAPLLKAVQKGFEWKTFERLADNVGIGTEELAAAADLPKRTRARRKAEGRFHADESDRLLRIARIYARALDLFAGDRAAALRWLTERKNALGGAVPLDLVRTELGAREIEATIDRIEHGVFM